MRKAFKFITELADGIGFAFEDGAKYLGRSIINKPVKWGTALGVRLAPKREKAKSAGLAIAAAGVTCCLFGSLGALMLAGLGGASLSLSLVALGTVLLPVSLGFGVGMLRVGENLQEGKPLDLNDDTGKKASAENNASSLTSKYIGRQICAKAPQDDPSLQDLQRVAQSMSRSLRIEFQNAVNGQPEILPANDKELVITVDRNNTIAAIRANP